MLRSTFTFHPAARIRLSRAMSSSSSVPMLVSPAWLKERLLRGDGGVVPVDATWVVPPLARDTRQEYLARHIPTARYFDIDEIKDDASDLPHMLPREPEFSRAVGEGLGIGRTDHIVVYDSSPMMSAFRVYWTFLVFGHERVSVLDGGLGAWEREGGELVSGKETLLPKPYAAKYSPSLVAKYDNVLRTVEGKDRDGKQTVIIDARPLNRFMGREPEPRPGLVSGHMPGAVCIPLNMLADAEGRLLDGETLRRVFAKAGVSMTGGRAITTCGSGVMACVLYAALRRAGCHDVRVYDGSWSEYGITTKHAPVTSE